MHSEQSRERVIASSERQLLQRAQKGDQAAFSAVCARYVDSVYDFSLSVLGDESLAAGAAAATFADATANVHAFARSPSPRAWLLSSARKRCVSEPPCGREEAFASLERAEAVPGAAVEVGDDELLAAARSLGVERHVLLDLQIRQELTPAELAIAAGVSAESGAVLAARVSQTADGDLRAALLGAHCPSLETILARAEQPGVRQRARELATHHVERCGRCARTDGALGDPLERYAALPRAVAPAATRAIVLRSVLRGWPPRTGSAGDAWRATAGQDAGRLGRRLLFAFVPLAAGAVGLAALLVLPASPVALTRERRVSAAAILLNGGNVASPTPDATTATPPAPSAAAIAPIVVTPPATPSPSPTVAPSPSPAPSPTPTRPATSTPTPPSTPTRTVPSPTPTAPPVEPTPTPATPEPTPTATACIGNIQANVPKLTLLPGVRSSFVLFNTSECASASFAIGAPSVAWLQIETRAGVIPALRSTTIFLLGDPLTPARTTMQITGPNGTFTIEIEVK